MSSEDLKEYFKTTIDVRKYVLEMGKYMDDNFEPNQELTKEKIHDIIKDDLVDYIQRNISPDMAGEFIAHKLNLVRTVKGRN